MIRLLMICWLGLGSFAQAQLSDFEGIDFHRADSVAALYQGEKLNNLPLLALNLTEGLPTQVEKFRSIYTWVCTNIDNDHNAYLRNRKNRAKIGNDSLALENWNRVFRLKVFKKLLKEQRTVCTGYAYLIRELASFADIPCEIIDGYGRTITANIEGIPVPNHSWNAVQLNGKWYLCDATWSSGSFSIPDYVFVRDYHDGYFLANPELFIMSHYPLNKKWMLTETKPSLDDFMNYPLAYKHAFRYQVIPVTPTKMKTSNAKGQPIHLQMKAPDSLKIANLNIELVIGSNNYEVIPDIEWTESGLLDISFEFPRKGRHDVHIKMGDKAMITYVVKVRKN